MKPKLKIVEFPDKKKRAIQYVIGSLRKHVKDNEVVGVTVLWTHKDGTMYRNSTETNGTQLWQFERAKKAIFG